MKLIKRMLILNWHYINKEMIEFETINFLTGKNASGKSTLIDAMQLLLLGDTAGRYFNKAANDKSSRTLLGYLKGELSDQDTGFNYLRNKDFSSHLVMEVFDNEKKEFSLLGFIADVTGDHVNHQFYTADCQIPDDHFTSHKQAKSKRDIKLYFDHLNIKNVFYNSNRQYRESFRFKMGQVNENYFSLFKKAVPFTPITDIKAFITEFICDAENTVDITDMKDNIRYYERMKEGAEEIEVMINDLEIIETSYKDYSTEKDKVYVYQFLLDYAGYSNLIDTKNKNDRALETCKEKLKEHERQVVDLEVNLLSNNESIENKLIQLRAFEPYKLKASYEEKIGQLRRQINEIDKSIELIKDRFLSRLIQWQAASENELAYKIKEAIHAVRSYDFDYAISEVAHDINAYSEALNLKRFELNAVQEERRNTIEEIKSIINKLQSGIKHYPESVLELKTLISNNLNEIYDEHIDVQILCELIEIKDKRWTDAIEGYLHTQKYHLIVEPKYFVDALKIYDGNKKEMKLYGVGLVDVEKMSRRESIPKAGSLAEEILTESPYAQSYVNYLLGQVIKCDAVEDIRHYKIGITDTCMLYKNYVASQMNPKRYKYPVIGQQAIKHQLELRTLELNDLITAYDSAKVEYLHLSKLANLNTFNEDILEDYKEAGYDYKKLEMMHIEMESIQLKLSQIDTSSIFILEEEIQSMKLEIDKINKELIDIKSDIKQEKRYQNELEEKQPHLVNKINSSYEQIYTLYSESYISEVGLVRFNSELERLGRAARIIDNFEKVHTGSINKVKELQSKLFELRSKFNRTYRRDLGITSEDNTKYQDFLEDLKNTELPSFKSQIEVAIAKAQEEFQDDFISKLKSNIDEVSSQIKGLNSSLKNISFGKDTYKFSVKPNPYYRAYYDMIMDKDLMEGYSLFSIDFREKHGDVINDLFKQIIDVGEGALSMDEREELEKNIQKYTDYRTYLDFDLIVTNASGETQHLSKMIDKKSGGETQTPFYISVLASFSKIYRINNINNNNTMRLIIFDEAFSKMDHERIEESLKLLRNMGFQALISAPTEKIANISPLADKTLCVLRHKKATIVREYDIIKDWTTS